MDDDVCVCDHIRGDHNLEDWLEPCRVCDCPFFEQDEADFLG